MNQKQPQRDSSAENAAADDSVIGRAFIVSLGVIAALVGVVGVGVWWVTRPGPPPDNTATVLVQPKTREAPALEIPEVRFTNVTEAAGIKFRHFNGARGEKLLPETMGGGCAFVDFDHDGDQDILFVNGCDWPWTKDKPESQPTLTLYRNDGSGKFEDATAGSGLEVSFFGMGVAVGDYDNDGWPDLFISAVGRDYLFHNEQGKFLDVTESAGVGGSENEWGTSCCWFDCDNDGDLDLFVGNYVRWSREIDMAQFFSLDGQHRAYGPPFAFQGTFPYLYRNDGQGKFADISAESGVQVKNPNTGVPLAKTMGVVPVDLDDDGLLDLIVANDSVQNFLLHNLGGGRFEETGAMAGLAFDSQGNARGAMGIDAARFRDHKTVGVLIGNFANEMTALYVSSAPLQFVDAATATGLGPPTRLSLTFGVFFFDYDLDGRLDLLSANGHLEEDINKVQPTQHYAQPPKLFWNCGPEQGTEFVPVPEAKSGPDLVERMVGRGSAFADIDGDGDLDVLIGACGAAPRLLRNDQTLGHAWLRVKLIGKQCNRDAIGVRVDLHAAGQILSRDVSPTHSYLSQSENVVTFGVGSAKQIEKFVIRWPDGARQEVVAPAVGKTHVIEQAANETSSGT